jgi:hypothetical protein
VTENVILCLKERHFIQKVLASGKEVEEVCGIQ